MGIGNRCRELVSEAPGTGAVSLGGAKAGFTKFNAHYSDADAVEYWIEDVDDFEHGYGIYTATGDSISRNTILETLVGGVYDDTTPAAIDASVNAEIYTAPSEEQRRWLPQPFIDGYTEDGEDDTLAPSAGTLTVPLDGRRYRVVVTETLTLAVIAPTPPEVGSAELDLVQDGTGGWGVNYPAGWFWPDGTAVDADVTAGARTRLVLSSAPNGDIDADGGVRGVVA